MKKLNFLFSIIPLFFLSSCDSDLQYFPDNEGKHFFYNVFFQDKEKKKKNFRQSYYFLPKTKNAVPVLKNDGEITFYVKNEKGVIKKSLKKFLSPEVNEYSDSDLLIAFPITTDMQWETEDKTTLQMKLGYDRIFETNLPFKLTNKIVNVNDTIKVDGNTIKNCLKIIGTGKTSYNPGPPLGNINIEVVTTTWFAKGLGLVKYKREEKSDSETMGKIYYEKTLMFDN